MTLPFNEPFAASWQEWLTYRKERRLPCYKPLGLSKTINRLVLLSDNNESEAIKIIDYSISQNYQGLFKEKSYGKSNSNGTTQSEQLNNIYTSVEGFIANNQ